MQKVFLWILRLIGILNQKQPTIFFNKLLKNKDIIKKIIINPGTEEILKSVLAQYTAEETITRRGDVETTLDEFLTKRLEKYNLAVDYVYLVHIRSFDSFREAVEVKWAEPVALRAAKQAKVIWVKKTA
jgi:regulator of protease activity HflC (stomatin/prohibitin superfamily)